MSATKSVEYLKLHYRVKNINISKQEMFGGFPIAHCHFKIENNLLLGEITFSEKTKVSRMLKINNQNVKDFFIFFIFAKYKKISYWRIFAIIIASIWAHIFITEG